MLDTRSASRGYFWQEPCTLTESHAGCFLSRPQGDITDVAAGHPPSLGRMDDAAAGRLPVGSARPVHHSPFKSSLKVVDKPRVVPLKGDQTQAICQVLLERRVERRAVAAPTTVKWVGDAGTLDEGKLLRQNSNLVSSHDVRS